MIISKSVCKNAASSFPGAGLVLSAGFPGPTSCCGVSSGIGAMCCSWQEKAGTAIRKKTPQLLHRFLNQWHNDIHRSRYDRTDGEGGEITISAPRLLVWVALRTKLVPCVPRGPWEWLQEHFPAPEQKRTQIQFFALPVKFVIPS